MPKALILCVLLLCFYFVLLSTDSNRVLCVLNVNDVGCKYPPVHGQHSWLGTTFSVVSLVWILRNTQHLTRRTTVQCLYGVVYRFIPEQSVRKRESIRWK